MKKALLVDDNEQNLYLLKTMLKGQGYNVMTAANGVEALELARHAPPDIVVSDVLMPVMDGFALCREWRADERLKEIPFIFYTATYTDPKDEDFGIRLGAARFVVKPQDPEAFVALLQQVIKEYKSNPPLAPAQPSPIETGYYKLYSEALVRKLEDKMLELEQINRVLKESEKRYRLLAENVQDVIFVLDLDLNYTYVSPSVKALRGYEPEEVLEQPASETLTPVSWDLAVNTVYEEMEREKAGQPDLHRSRTLKLEMRRKDGSTVCTEVKVSFIRDEDHRPVGILGVTRDITERMQAEDALRLSEQKFITAFQFSPTAITITSAKDGLIVETNASLLRITGYEREEVIGHTSTDLKLWVDNAARDRYVALLREHGRVFEMEADFRIRSGEVRNCLVSGELIDIGGRPHILGVISDITERRRMEETLKASEEKHRTLFESSPDAIMTLAPPSWRFTTGNPASVEMFEACDEAAFTALGPWEFSPEFQPDGRPSSEKAAEMIQTAMANGSHSFEWIHRRLGGESFPATVLLTRMELGGQDLLQATVRDITERKQAEEQLQHTLESLRNAVSATIQIMTTTVEARDPYTAGHQTRSADLARAIATEMELPQDKIDAIRMAGSIHDIGKISVPAEILSKPTKLTDLEFSLIKEHSRRGYEILKGVESPWNLAEIAYQHHERMDGSGYPRHLKGEEILIEARILAVADTVEAMASHRPYRPGLGIDAALAEIEKNKGLLYDADAADGCLRLFREKRYELPQG